MYNFLNMIHILPAWAEGCVWVVVYSNLQVISSHLTHLVVMWLTTMSEHLHLRTMYTEDVMRDLAQCFAISI